MNVGITFELQWMDQLQNNQGMMHEFIGLLQAPKQSPVDVLKETQSLILSSFEKILPSTSDLSYINTIFEETIGLNPLSTDEQIPVTLHSLCLINYRLFSYFVQTIQDNFVELSVYEGLEQQTQKAESSIRSHIKIEHEMKVFMDYLQAKVAKCQKAMQSKGNATEGQLLREIDLLHSKQAIYQRQKINLIKSNEKLKDQIQNLHITLTCSPLIRAQKPQKARQQLKCLADNEMIMNSSGQASPIVRHGQLKHTLPNLLSTHMKLKQRSALEMGKGTEKKTKICAH